MVWMTLIQTMNIFVAARLITCARRFAAKKSALEPALGARRHIWTDTAENGPHRQDGKPQIPAGPTPTDRRTGRCRGNANWARGWRSPGAHCAGVAGQSWPILTALVGTDHRRVVAIRTTRDPAEPRRHARRRLRQRPARADPAHLAGSQRKSRRRAIVGPLPGGRRRPGDA